jgi:hypothetical protein
MAHYALLDENNIVTNVFVGKHENEGNTNWELHYGNIYGKTCKRTSYNTQGGVHATGGTPLRKNYAGIGYTYDPSRNAFIPPRPFASWQLDEQSCLWTPPTPYPTDVGTAHSPKFYTWDESTLSWILMK